MPYQPRPHSCVISTKQEHRINARKVLANFSSTRAPPIKTVHLPDHARHAPDPTETIDHERINSNARAALRPFKNPPLRVFLPLASLAQPTHPLARCLKRLESLSATYPLHPLIPTVFFKNQIRRFTIRTRGTPAKSFLTPQLSNPALWARPTISAL